MSTPNYPPGELLAYLRMLTAGARPGQFVDVRWTLPGRGMGQRFIAAERVERAAQLITRLAARVDVYVGVALRDRRYGGKSAIRGSWLLYIECDEPDAHNRLEGFPYQPSMILASGTPGHLHVYWSLRERASNTQVESANRRLALALAGDPTCVDIARILRPPATVNHKHNPPRPVGLVGLAPGVRHDLAKLTGNLPADPSPDQPPSLSACAPRRRADSDVDRALLAIPAAEYVRVLARREPNRAGKILCPFHQEQTPSLQLYPDGTFYCYGRLNKTTPCRKGGTIFDFAAAHWGMSTRGEDFIELRRRLADLFALTPIPTRP